MDIKDLQTNNITKIVTISFRINTIIRIKKFMKDNKIKKFSPIVDKIINDWLDIQNKDEAKRNDGKGKV